MRPFEPDEEQYDMDATETNPMWVRHQLCLATLEELREVEDVGDRINSALCVLAAHYDGVSEVILNDYFEFVEINLHDPVAERVIKDQVNVFHVADLLRISEPFADPHWLCPENAEAFRALVDTDLAAFLQDTREQSRQFRGSIQNAIDEYVRMNP